MRLTGSKRVLCYRMIQYKAIAKPATKRAKATPPRIQANVKLLHWSWRNPHLGLFAGREPPRSAQNEASLA